MDGRPAAELQGLLEFFAVHRRAADRGEAVCRAVEVDVARNNPGIVILEIPQFLRQENRRALENKG